MNYNKIYFSIIENAKQRTIQNEYVEKHHIVPKCLGGDNSKLNLVSLTYREHFVCHWLLCKIYPEDYKLKAAFAKMLEIKGNRVTSSWMFDTVKKNLKDIHYPWLEESWKIPWNKGKRGLQVAWNKGLKQPCTEERKKKTSESLKNRYKETHHHRKGTPSWNSGKTGLQEAWNKNKTMPKSECIHCRKMVDIMNMKRWHGDKCKNKSL
jgi:hypothetical protein